MGLERHIRELKAEAVCRILVTTWNRYAEFQHDPAPDMILEVAHVFRAVRPDGREVFVWSTSPRCQGIRWTIGESETLAEVAEELLDVVARNSAWRGILWQDLEWREESPEYGSAKVEFWSHQAQAAFGKSLAASGGIAYMVNKQRGAALVDDRPDPDYAPDPGWHVAVPDGWALRSLRV